MAHLSTEHLPHQQAPSSIEELRQSGISPYRSMTGNSTHSSLYRQLRNPSPVPHASQSPTVTTAVTGQMRSSSAQDVELEFTAGTGHESPDSSGQSHNLHQSYSCPLSRDTMSIPLTRQQEKAPLQEYPRRPDTPIPTIPDAGTISESTPEPPQSPDDPGSTSDDTA